MHIFRHMVYSMELGPTQYIIQSHRHKSLVPILEELPPWLTLFLKALRLHTFSESSVGF